LKFTDVSSITIIPTKYSSHTVISTKVAKSQLFTPRFQAWSDITEIDIRMLSTAFERPGGLLQRYKKQLSYPTYNWASFIKNLAGGSFTPVAGTRVNKVAVRGRRWRSISACTVWFAAYTAYGKPMGKNVT
jgi:hypothetical protein